MHKTSKVYIINTLYNIFNKLTIKFYFFCKTFLTKTKIIYIIC
nr:MAG TPA: hypothetical protein [Caudoviricetes sp.]